MRRIGITCRILDNERYPEPRDALSQDWQVFMTAVLPHAAWLPLPNLSETIADFVRAWELDGFILSGGDTPGECPRRDRTERMLLDLAVARRLPVFGVCRGAQMINVYFGGGLSLCPDQRHIGSRHEVAFVDGTIRQVNSFHAFRIQAGELAAHLTPLAFTAESDIEAFAHASLPIKAVMWHPEREVGSASEDIAMFRSLFKEFPL